MGAWAALAVGGALAVGSAATALSQPAPDEPSPQAPTAQTQTPTPAAQSRAQQLLAALTDPKASAEARAAAAAALLDQDRPQELAARLDDAAPEVAEAVARALLAREDPAPAPLLAMLGGRLADRASQSEAAATLQLLIAQPTKEAVGACVAALDRSEGWRRQTTLTALALMTGREDLGEDANRWRRWWETARWLPEAQWSQQLFRWRAQRLARLEDERAVLERRLTTALRELHARLGEEEKPARLEAMLRDPLTLVRLAGLDLVERDLLNARGASEAVAEAITALLRDQSEAVRLRASGLLLRLGDGVEEARVALAVEESPLVAANLLRALAQAPRSTDAAAGLRWLAVETQAPRAAAAELLARLVADASLQQPETRARLTALLRRRAEQGTLLGPEAALLAWVGEAADRTAMAQLVLAKQALAEQEAGTEWAPALAALAAWPDTAEQLLAGDGVPAATLVAAARTVGRLSAAARLLRAASEAAEGDRRSLLREAAALAWDEGASEAALSELREAGSAALEAFAAATLEVVEERLSGVSAVAAPQLLDPQCRLTAFVAGLADAGLGAPAKAAAALLVKMSASAPHQVDAQHAGAVDPPSCPPQRRRALAVAVLWAFGARDDALEAAQDPAVGVMAVEALQGRHWGRANAPALAATLLQRLRESLSPEQRRRLERALVEGDPERVADPPPSG